MMKFSVSRRSAPVLAAVLGVSAALVVGGLGCSRLDYFNAEIDSVSPDSAAITYDSYRNRKVLIKLPPGGGNTAISWETLYSEIPDSSFKRKRLSPYASDPQGLKRYLDSAFDKSMASITRDPRTLQTIKKVGELYGVSPVTILSTIMGEHTFNVSLADDIQNLVGAAPGWATGWMKKFSTVSLGMGTSLVEILAKPEFDGCRNPARIKNEADRWECYNNVWGAKFSGQVDESSAVKAKWPSGGLRTVFFNPTGVGLTYGLGQLDPQRALMVADRVRDIGGLPMISIEDPQRIYETIINPNTGLHYVAANIRLAIERYADIANFDITANPGISATLYNNGHEKKKALERYQENLALLKKGQPMVLPSESYYGWYVNTRLADIQRVVDTGR